MKELFKQINKVDRQISRTMSRIEDVKTMPYYSIYGSETERVKDLSTCKDYLNDCLDRKHLLLENLILECNKELMGVATLEQLKTA